MTALLGHGSGDASPELVSPELVSPELVSAVVERPVVEAPVPESQVSGLRVPGVRVLGPLVLAVLVLAAVLVAVLSGGRAPAVGPIRTVVSGPAPAFRLVALGHGGWVTLPAGGEPVVLSFFASWCEGCQAEMSVMSRLAAQAGARVRIVGIDVSDDPSAARSLLARNHITYAVGIDDGYRTAQSYGLVGLPTTVYLDGRHEMVGRTVGPLTGAVGDAWLAALVGGRP